MTIPSRTGVTAGVTAGPPPDGRSWRHRRRIVAGLVATGLASTSLLTPGLAAAAVPTFPDNVVVFPDRDFVTIEGYQDHIGETAPVEVTRGGQVVGSAKGVVAAGDVAFEVNHPGGVLLGRGHRPQGHPGHPRRRRRLDHVRRTARAGDTTRADAAVTTDMRARTAAPLTVTGHIGAGVNPAQIEQRIVNPDLVGTAVGKRDIRAVPGPLTAGRQGRLLVGPRVRPATTFTATYVFDDPAVARSPPNGGSGSGSCPGRSRTPTPTARA